MVSVNTLCKNILNVKNSVIEYCNFYHSADGVKHIRIKARTNNWHENDCLFCHKPCPLYDRHSSVPVMQAASLWKWNIRHTVLSALIVRKAYGFRNIQNMLDMVYLVCSDLRFPLPNRKTTAA